MNKEMKKFKKINKRKKKLKVRNHTNKAYRRKEIKGHLTPIHSNLFGAVG